MKEGLMNRVIKIMIFSDLVILLGEGLISPLFAIFVTRQIEGATIATAGFATTIFWVVKSLSQLLVARTIDGIDGEKDDYWLLISGTLLAAFAPIAFLFARVVWHIYAIQCVSGIAWACMFPTYMAIFTRHIDKKNEGFEWSLRSVAYGLGYAVASGLGGVIAEKFGFRIALIANATSLILGALILLLLRDDVARVLSSGKRRKNLADARVIS